MVVRQLNINKYETKFVLGNNASEKCEVCRVVIDVSLRFLDDMPACVSDDLGDAICYSSLTKFIDEIFMGADFNLVERASQFLYDKLSLCLKNYPVLKRVELTKPFSSGELPESVSFVCSDW
jgi:dihydroneopterin aldolase